MGVSFLVGGSGSFRVPCLHNKCYGTTFRRATFVSRTGYTHGGNDFPKRAVRHSKRPKITPRLSYPTQHLFVAQRGCWPVFCPVSCK